MTTHFIPSLLFSLHSFILSLFFLLFSSPFFYFSLECSGSKRTTLQLSGQVVERANPRPMSAAAMMRKREDGAVGLSGGGGGGKMARNMLGSASSGAILTRTPTTPTTSTIHANIAGASAVDGALGVYDRDEVDKGDDEGEMWVDVDPAELLAMGYQGPGSAGAGAGSAGYDSAMSIEGYIANVKKSIRVSPATTIKNLSHSPYTYQDINHHVNAGELVHSILQQMSSICI